ncbi:MAG: DUF922 domain-containing protein [Sphingobacteriales bacterium]|nr:MAG: DUF922 domain-containing protein [Sphingobacteriales bacterium]
MRKRLLLIALHFMCPLLCSFVQDDSEEVIHWDKSKLLKYSDFKADTSFAKHSAISCLKIIPSLYIDGYKLKYSIRAGFYTGCSYMRHRDKQLLEHEQRHFDMVEIYARKMRQYLSSCANTRVTTKELNLTLTQIDADLQAVQVLYDKVTQHGLKPRAQLHWNKQIDATLDSLNAYGSPDGDVLLEGNFP